MVGCDLALTLCNYDFRNRDFFGSELDKGATGEVGKYLFKAANFLMSVWGSVGMFVVCWPLLNIVFLALEC